MARKRKVVEHNIVSKEDKTSNACSVTTIGEEKIPSHTDHHSDIKETVNIENTVRPDSISLPPKVTSVFVRRSGRLKSSVLPNGSQNVENVLDQVNLIENEKEVPQVHQASTLPVVSERNLEFEAPQVEQVSSLPVTRDRNLEEEPPQTQQLNHVLVNEKDLEEKVNYIIRTVDEFKSKVTRRPNEGPSTDLKYKSLYFDSQKKIEALMEKHYELVKALEFANGKIEAYEKMNDAMHSSKEVILVSRLGIATEATVNLSPQKVRGEDAHDQNVSPKQINYKKKRARS
ncbi:hypothetical protein BUALT_Bualt02G0220500 [Buddleja alternifolia]|uniref:Uncharacterized protein n=1 Tax=Buddleja alternifolia TaxID=168488 RepID=A0AAV6Y4G1_9LAMI|nr:hypothetical protein BUALT_Bualt02G0220500 [Buddleja alternifolia]